jgi:hypothetical protein
MWNKFLGLARFLFSYSEKLERCELRIDEIQRDMTDVITSIEILTLKIEHLQESQKEQHEKLLLQLENQLLRFEKRLAPPTN